MMAPSTVNDTARQAMADHRYQWEDAEWFNRYAAGTISRASATTFKINGVDATALFAKHRRVKCFDGSVLYGMIQTSTFSTDTTVTVGLDTGSLTTSLSAVGLAILSASNLSIPNSMGFKGADIASAATVDLSNATGDFVDVTGTTTITAFGTAAAGIERTVRFTGALTLTYNATSLILPTSANITTEANDRAIFRSLGSGNWICITYERADGRPLSQTANVHFLAKRGSTIADQTGDGTSYNIVFDSAVTNPGSHYATGTGVFTAPEAGLYSFYVNLVLTGINGTTTTELLCELIATGQTITVEMCKPSPETRTGDLTFGFANAAMINMAANDTVNVRLTVWGGAKQVDVTINSYFGGSIVN